MINIWITFACSGIIILSVVTAIFVLRKINTNAPARTTPISKPPVLKTNSVPFQTDSFSQYISHHIGNPANVVKLSLKSFEQIWMELQPILESFQNEHGDFEIGGYLYSELKISLPDSFKHAQENTDQIKKIAAALHLWDREK